MQKGNFHSPRGVVIVPQIVRVVAPFHELAGSETVALPTSFAYVPAFDFVPELSGSAGYVSNIARDDQHEVPKNPVPGE
jgi:hypothetical protein